MSGFTRLSLVLLFVSVSVDLYPQICLRKKNQFDCDGKKHGYWVTVSESNPRQKTFKGWFNHGNETRRCVYYMNGARFYKLRYVNDSVMRIRRYSEHGNIEYKGSALWLTKNNELRFCWDGEFVFYDANRHKTRKVAYIRGEEQDLE